MKVTRRIAAIGGVSLLGSAALTSVARAEFAQWLEGIGEGLEDFWIATDAYIYGYPLVTMEMPTVGHNECRCAGETLAPPIGDPIKLRPYSRCDLYRDVTAPDADRFLHRPPLSISARNRQGALGRTDMKERYFLMPCSKRVKPILLKSPAPGQLEPARDYQAVTEYGWSGTLPPA